jgi:hypothetical protein
LPDYFAIDAKTRVQRIVHHEHRAKRIIFSTDHANAAVLIVGFLRP